MPDAMVYFDADDRFLIWNRSYQETVARFGVTPQFGRTFEECDPRRRLDEEAGIHPAEARALWRGPAATSREMRGPDGRWLRVEERQVEGGGRVVVVFDISSLMETADNLALARDAAEAANRAKSEFLANMSHEIRTPLNGVMGVADALALTPLSDDQRELVGIIRTSGASLTRLLSDLLDLARVEAGAVRLVQEPFNLAAAVTSVAQLSAVSAHEKGIAFRLDMAPQANRWVLGDPGRLKQILTNLASNAVKFTDVGEVELSLVCFDERKGRFRFAVRDTGPGIDAELRSRVFGRFHQGDGEMNRRAGGSGLGLSIARQLATAMGGELDLQSVVGKGSTFTLTLELRPVDAPAEAPAPKEQPAKRPAAPAHEASLEACRVLVADDHPNNRRLMQVLLDHLGCESVYAEDGLQAVEAWRQGRFDAILMDLQMPNMDGLEATKAIRAAEIAERRPRVPIIVVSANAMPQHLEASRRAGADDHISKPVAADRLFKVLSGLAAGETLADEARSA